MNTTASRHLAPIRRSTRRALVVTQYAGFLGMVLAWSFMDAPLRWALVIPLGLASIVALGMLMAPRLLGTSDGADAELDERQLQIRNAGYLQAYRVLAAVVLLVALYLLMAGDSDWWFPTTENERTALFWGTWGLVLTLPGAILAWTEPDPE